MALWYYWVLRPMVYGCMLVYVGRCPTLCSMTLLAKPCIRRRVWIPANTNNKFRFCKALCYIVKEKPGTHTDPIEPNFSIWNSCLPWPSNQEVLQYRHHVAFLRVDSALMILKWCLTSVVMLSLSSIAFTFFAHQWLSKSVKIVKAQLVFRSKLLIINGYGCWFEL